MVCIDSVNAKICYVPIYQLGREGLATRQSPPIYFVEKDLGHYTFAYFKMVKEREH